MAVAVNWCHGYNKSSIHNRRCRFRSFPHPDINPLDLDPLNLSRPLNLTPPASPNIHRSFSSPCWTSSTNVNEASGSVPRLDVIGGHRNHALRALVVEATVAMASGMQLVPVSGGLGGTYYLQNRAGEKFAVLKPILEEHLFRSGPDSFRGCMIGRSGMRHSIRAADSCMSEVAAYLLDHGGFSGVPPTALIKVSHNSHHVSLPITTPPWKIASIQRFVTHDYDAGDVGPSRFSVSSVHRIGILDVRLLNIDRHTGNILVKNHAGSTSCYDSYASDGCELVPIDHELCLPERLDDPYFEWLHWPQAFVPFSDSEAEYIRSLDPFKDAELLRAEVPMLKEASIRILVLCTIFLKRAAEAGLCLAEIGGMMTREIRDLQKRPSQLEVICGHAQVGMAKILMRKIRSEMGVVEDKEFPRDMEFTESENEEESVEMPYFLQGKPPKVPKTMVIGGNSSCRVVRSLSGKKTENGEGDCIRDSKDIIRGETGVKLIAKSTSFNVSRNHHEIGFDLGNSGMSFEGLSEGEWGLFIGKFEELLLGAFKARKGLRFNRSLGATSEL